MTNVFSFVLTYSRPLIRFWRLSSLGGDVLILPICLSREIFGLLVFLHFSGITLPSAAATVACGSLNVN